MSFFGISFVERKEITNFAVKHRTLIEGACVESGVKPVQTLTMIVYRKCGDLCQNLYWVTTSKKESAEVCQQIL